MQREEYDAELLSDGHLSCPEDVKRRLGLNGGERLRVSLSLVKENMQERDIAQRPLKEFSSFRNMKAFGMWIDRKDISTTEEFSKELRKSWERNHAR